MGEKRFTIKKSGKGLFYSDEDYSIDNTIQFVIETVEFKLNQLNDENEELRKENEQLKQSIDTRISVEDNYRKHLEIYSDQYFKLKEYINELLTKKYKHYEEMKKTIRNKEAQRIYTNILKVIKDLQEDVDTEWGE